MRKFLCWLFGHQWDIEQSVVRYEPGAVIPVPDVAVKCVVDHIGGYYVLAASWWRCTRCRNVSIDDSTR